MAMDKKRKSILKYFWKHFLNFHMKNLQKPTKSYQILTKNVLFRKIARIFSSEKPCYLENRVRGGLPVTSERVRSIVNCKRNLAKKIFCTCDMHDTRVRCKNTQL